MASICIDVMWGVRAEAKPDRLHDQGKVIC